MVTLLVKFSEDIGLPDFTLHPVDPSHTHVVQGCVVHNATPIHYGNNAIVYRGELSQGGHPTEEVVLKLVDTLRQHTSSGLEKEFGFYCSQLKDLQGTVVPKCYGLFTSSDSINTALVLQYCGEEANSMDPESPFQNMTTKLDIVDHLLELHERGIQHGDFAEHNIVIDEDGKPFIVDFEHAETHECERTEDIIEGAIAPDKWDFGCYEIFDFCYDHRIWRTGCLYFVGIAILEERATSVEEIVKAAREKGTSIDNRYLLEEAHKVYKLAEAIKANRGLLPRYPKLKALGITGYISA